MIAQIETAAKRAFMILPPLTQLLPDYSDPCTSIARKAGLSPAAGFPDGNFSSQNPDRIIWIFCLFCQEQKW